MENNVNQQNAQDVVPSLDTVLDSNPIVGNENIVEDHIENQNPPAGDQGEGGNPPSGEQTPPASTDPPQQTTPPINSVEDDVVKLLSTEDSLLSADDKEFKEGVYAQFGAVNIDFKGNLLDAQGQVVLTSADLDNYIETGEVPVDENGNQINAKGEIVKNAADVAASTNVVDLTRSLIEQELGLELKDEQGKPKTYANSAEGNKEFVKDAVLAAQTTAVASFLGNNPELKDIYFHLANGGNLNDFVNDVVDYSNIDINELSKEQKIDYIKKSYEKQGMKNMNTMLSLVENAGDDKITQAAAEAILALKEIDDANRAANQQAVAEAEQAEQKRIADYWTEVNSVITKGNLKDLQIPVNERQDFYKYIAEPINAKGETREMIDAAKEGMDFNLMVSYVRYKGGDISTLVRTKSQGNKLDKLRHRMGIGTSIPKIDASKERQTNQNSSSFVPSIENVLG